MAKPHDTELPDDAGFIMVDALVGAVIVSLMIAVVLATLRISQNHLRTISEMRQAQVLLQSLMETTPRTTGTYDGRTERFSHSVGVSEEGGTGAKLCALKAQATSRTRKRTYRLEGVRWCAQGAL